MKTLYKRILVATGLGMILGVICVIGQAQRGPVDPLPNTVIYLLGAWYNRVLIGIMIGLAGDITIYKTSTHWMNSAIRGAIIGLLLSTAFGLLSQSLELLYFFAGILWGIIIDVVTTRFVK